MFEQVIPQKYYMQIARQIRNSIRDGELHIGDKLPPERALAEQFGASRASIREALSALEMLGLVVCKGGQGNYVNADGSEGTIDGELLKSLLMGHDPFEIFEARLELEPCLAALAADRATAVEKKSLQRHLKKLEFITVRINDGETKVVEEYMEEDRKLHLEIGRCAHNSVLFTVFSGVNLMMKETHWKKLKGEALLIKGNPERYMIEHRVLIDAIVAGDGEKARFEMHKHI
ncbi:MAG: FadR family transcriptional regulator, partial [Spirochaetales bacterium]|nr:FadR family transcriptional regulator [Spirochaetales bacterium]